MASKGRTYALFFASRGAKVVVNDTGGCVKGEGSDRKFVDEVSSSKSNIFEVVALIKKNGGQAAGNYDSVVEGEKIIKFANDTFGRVDILINNAGIIRDISFMKITNKDWDLVVDVIGCLIYHSFKNQRLISKELTYSAKQPGTK
jgi:NAD(P)-dependent dehydrogenase (short-subunit alcohol dehydrogenase family)